MESKTHPKLKYENESWHKRSSMPALPAVDWGSIGGEAPAWVTDDKWDPNNNTYPVDMVIMTWTSAEWAAFDHIFCNSDKEMPYNYYESDSWRNEWKYYSNGWDTISKDLPSKAPSLTNKAWGSCRIVKFPGNGKSALLLKSDMHISTDGPELPLRNMVQQLITDFSPSFVFTIGTSGGSRVHDCIGTANVTNAARFDLSGEFDKMHFDFNHKTFKNDWEPNAAWIKKMADSSLLMQTPVTDAELQTMVNDNTKELTNPDTHEVYTLAQLRNAEIQPGAVPPKINILTGTPVLTTNGYVVGNTSGNYDDFAVMEMDDAVIGMMSNKNNTAWGVCRNISDPVQNAGINETIQANWGGIVYREYGLYTSYNGALAAWAAIAN